MHNPDPKKYAIVQRKGELILVDKQIVKWRRRKRKERLKAQDDLQALKVKENLFTGSTERLKPISDPMPNLFSDEEDLKDV